MTDQTPMSETDLEQVRAYANGETPASVDAASQGRIIAQEMLSEVDRLHTWDGLMSLLDQHWPEDLFPGSYDPSRDDGARIVGLLRWVGNLVGDVESCEQRVRSYESVNARLRADLEESTELLHSAERDRADLRERLAALTADHLGHIDRVTRAAVDRADALAAKVAAVREVHRPYDFPDVEGQWCEECMPCADFVHHDTPHAEWPCETIRALDSEPAHETPQRAASGPDSAGGSTGRGTDVPEPHGTTQTFDPREAADSLDGYARARIDTAPDALAYARAEGIAEAARLLRSTAKDHTEGND